jgi:hypothetical protein
MRLFVLVVSFAFAAAASADDLVELSEEAYADSGGKHGVILYEINWGRRWGCAGLDNAQLQALTFSQGEGAPTLELKTPSRLFVDNRFTAYALLVEPGNYTLTGFDVKVARSTTDVGHLIWNEKNGGTFTIGAGEFVYIGHFGLDCAQEPIPWRYYVEGRNEFERYVAGFRERYPFVGDVTVRFGLLDTELFGTAYSLLDGS